MCTNKISQKRLTFLLLLMSFLLQPTAPKPASKSDVQKLSSKATFKTSMHGRYLTCGSSPRWALKRVGYPNWTQIFRLVLWHTAMQSHSTLYSTFTYNVFIFYNICFTWLKKEKKQFINEFSLNQALRICLERSPEAIYFSTHQFELIHNKIIFKQI